MLAQSEPIKRRTLYNNRDTVKWSNKNIGATHIIRDTFLDDLRPSPHVTFGDIVPYPHPRITHSFPQFLRVLLNMLWIVRGPEVPRLEVG